MIDQYLNDFSVILFIFLRIIGLFSSAPIFNHKALPVSSKILLAFIIAYISFSSGTVTFVTSEISTWMLFVYGIKELITGIMIGYFISLIFMAFNIAGSIIGFEMGLTMAEIFNPSEGTSNNIIGENLHILALLIFILINGHHYLIRSIVYSFSIIQIGELQLNSETIKVLISTSANIIVIGIKVASPILISFFLVHIAEGVLARVIPQMQVIFVTQPLKLSLGFILLASLIPLYIYTIKNLLKSYEDNLFLLLQGGI